jgi:hypothetical protein
MVLEESTMKLTVNTGVSLMRKKGRELTQVAK